MDDKKFSSFQVIVKNSLNKMWCNIFKFKVGRFPQAAGKKVPSNDELEAVKGIAESFTNQLY